MVVALLFFLQTEECLVISKVQPQFWIILTSITTFKTETTEEWVIGRSYTLQFFCWIMQWQGESSSAPLLSRNAMLSNDEDRKTRWELSNEWLSEAFCVTSKIMVRAKRRLHLGETSRDNPNNGSRCKDYICLIEKLRDNPNNSRESLRDISNNSSRCNEDYACLKEALRDNLSKGSRCRLHLPWRSIAWQSRQ